MINALVVDDEKMARKGLMSLTDWSKYDISFVGEAKDGIQALHFLTKQTVDVLFVDITMPNMNGFELMKQVQAQYPDIAFVILTCHHEFDYVQEALQIGAIDYIVKTLLNRNNVDETVTRIVTRLKRDKDKAIQEQHNTYEGGLYFVHEQVQSMASTYRFPTHIPHIELNSKLIRLGRNTDIQLTSTERMSLLEDGYLVQLSPCEKLEREQVENWLSNQFNAYRFYTSDAREHQITEVQLAKQLEAWKHIDRKQLMKQWQEQLEQFRWLIYPQDWSKFQSLTVQAQPEPNKITLLVGHMYRQLVQTLHWQIDALHVLPLHAPNSSSWSEVEQWLTQLSLHLRGRMTDLSLSHEVVLCMIKAIQLMHRQLGVELNQNEIAYEVGMSRSYFSQCFKRFFGISFGEVLRQLRIETAKQLLLSTHQTIAEIANASGFDDHKYFSRTFKAQIGMYPTEYRSLHFVTR